MVENKTTKITIVIPVHNRKKHTLNCLHQLQTLEKKGMDITIVVVDDGSSDGTSELIASGYPEVVILRGNGNLWWSGATNVGVEYALEHNSDYVLALNDDVEFKDDFLVNLLKTVKTYDNSIACGILCDINSKDTIMCAGIRAKGFLHYIYCGHLSGADVSVLPKEDFESDVTSGCAMLISTKIFREVGLFDAKKFPHHMGDFDFILRAKKKGFKVIVNPRSFLYTKIGDNYFYIQIIKESLWHNIKSFFDIKSTVNLRTRWYFYWLYTPYFLGWVSFLYFLSRMSFVIGCKLILPSKILVRVMDKRGIWVRSMK